MEIHVSLVGRTDLTRQIYTQIRHNIVRGVLADGDELPSSRSLAERLSVSRNTVVAAYDHLLSDGLVESRSGIGYFVRASPPAPRERRPARGRSSVQARALWDDLPEPLDMSAQAPAFDFRSGVPSVADFPHGTWRALLSNQIRGRGASARREIYSDPAGYPALREALARQLTLSRAVLADATTVMITNGAQQALDLIARVMLEPGDVVAVEDPGYPMAQLAFTAHGTRVIGVPVDSEGLVVTELPDEARLVYVTPSHQYPLGVTMSLARREQLLAWAERVDAVIVEDDYDSEFRYAGRPLEPIQSLDRHGRVFYVGSFSKVMLPALRLGFVVAPPSIAGALRKAKFLSDWHTNGPSQGALSEFIDTGGYGKHVRRMRALYQARHDAILEILTRDFAGLLEPISSTVGLHLSAAGVGGELNDRDLVRSAKSVGVAVTALSALAVERPGRVTGLLIGYGAIPLERIPEGLARLRECF